MSEVLVLALAGWMITWALSFWSKLERLRSRIGIGYEYGPDGEVTDRWGTNRLADWVNCPSCVAVISAGAVLTWYWLGLPWNVLHGLAVLGAMLLIVRWWQGTRVKAEWWT